MARKTKNLRTPAAGGMACCNVESIITVDERGQMVLPKETRERAGIRSGDKLALISCEKIGGSSCLCLIKADELAGVVKNILGPLMQEALAHKEEKQDE